MSKDLDQLFTVLVVDDDPIIRKSLSRHLKKLDVNIVEAENGQEALQKVAENKPNLILLDVMMPKMNGYDVCKKLREDFKNKTIYIIMLSAKDKTAEKVQGLNYGADDYITKPFEPDELIARIQLGLRTMQEKEMATTDALTGLFNRYFFNNILMQELERTKRYNYPLSLILMDLDFFKKVNDNFGHDVGDLVLIESTNVVKNCCRIIDIPARWGGEEFIILLPQTDIDGATRLAERIRHGMEKNSFTTAGKVTASFGVVEMGKSDSDLFKRVDIALYNAKERGRNRVETDL